MLIIVTDALNSMYEVHNVLLKFGHFSHMITHCKASNTVYMSLTETMAVCKVTEFPSLKLFIFGRYPCLTLIRLLDIGPITASFVSMIHRGGSSFKHR